MQSKLISAILASGMLAALFGTAIGHVSANQGNEDSFGYRWTDSNSPTPSVTFNWIDISTTGTDTGLDGDDDYTGPLPIGFTFNFYGNSYNQFYVTTNGYIMFGGGSSDYSNDQMPSTSSPNNIICAYWDDMYVDYTDGSILYQSLGSSPNMQLVVEFHDVNRLGSYSTYLDFEIVLNETGEIWLQYNYLNGMTGSSASVGIENSDGSVGTQYSYGGSPSLSDGLAIMFSVGAVSMYPDQTLVGNLGDVLTYTLNVENHQTFTDSFDITYTSALGWSTELYSTYPTLLTDTNGNGVPDTGDIAADGSTTIQVTVQIPLAPAAWIETTSVTATSRVDPVNYDVAHLSSHVHPGIFDPPHSDAGVDTSGDTDFEQLSIQASLNINVPGDFYIYGYLYTNAWTYINYVYVYQSLSTGSQTMELLFDGRDIWVTSGDGPYYVQLYLYNDTWQLCDTDVYTTSDYQWSDFTPPGAYFTLPHDDYVVNEDLDPYNESLVVVAAVEVLVAGTYRVYSSMYDGWGNWLGQEFNDSYFDVGTHYVVFVYDNAYELYGNGYTGTYDVYFTLYDSVWHELDEDNYETGSYSYTSFDPVPGEIYSEWTDTPPTIDGTFSAGEWDDAVVQDLVESDPNNDLDSLILVMNNATHLFICYDVYGDTHLDGSDYSSFAFDTGDDGIATNGGEDQFYVGGTHAEGTVHYVWNETWWDYEYHCAPFDSGMTDHQGLAGAMGYGWSDLNGWDHRIFEYAIPLALIDASPGDTVGFVGRSTDQYGVHDWWWWDDSSWPLAYGSQPALANYGNLVLSMGAVNVTTDAAMSGTMGLNGWYTSNVVVTLTAYGGSGGVDYTNYRINGGAWTAYSTPLTFATTGSYTLDFYSVDMGSNIEPTNTVTFKLDNARPVTTATLSGTIGENGWYTSVVTATLSASDPAGGSGLNYTRYRIGSGGWQAYSGSGLSFTTDGSMSMYYYSVDNASGAEAAKSIGVKVDRSKPVTTALVAGENFTLSAGDQTSGVNRTFYRIDEGSWTVYTGKVTVTGHGNHTIEFFSTDFAGNSEDIQTTYVDIEDDGGTLGGGDAILWVALIGAVIGAILLLLLVMMMRRKKQEQQGMYPPPPQMAPPPVQ